jgi:DNA-binding FadR family transcriptional regulator
MIYKEMEDLKDHFDRSSWEHHDADFHHIIARGTRNERLIRAVSSIYEECFYLNNTFLYKSMDVAMDPEHLAEVLGEHRAILDAIADDNPDGAEAAARASVRAATSRLMSSIAGSHGASITRRSGSRN